MKTCAALMGALTLAGAADAATAAPVQTYVEATGPSGVLKGTMLAPEQAKGAPVVLIIPGSGPTDRDGNNPLGVKASSYRLLAEGLADRGVASVRIDKRGMFASAAALANPNDVTIDAYADDALAWAESIKRQTGAPCVWIAGHSEGGLVAEVAAGKDSRKDVCGLVLISAAGRKLADVMREQLKANPANAPLLDQALMAIAELEAGRRVDVSGFPPPLQGLFNPAVQGFVINDFSYDPVALLKAYKGPVLVLQGTTDLQVSVAEDAQRLADARPGVTLVVLDGVNHVLKAAPADRAGNIATYADPSLPLAPSVAEAVADFVKGAGGR